MNQSSQPPYHHDPAAYPQPHGTNPTPTAHGSPYAPPYAPPHPQAGHHPGPYVQRPVPAAVPNKGVPAWMVVACVAAVIGFILLAALLPEVPVDGDGTSEGVGAHDGRLGELEAHAELGTVWGSDPMADKVAGIVVGGLNEFDLATSDVGVAVAIVRGDTRHVVIVGRMSSATRFASWLDGDQKYLLELLQTTVGYGLSSADHMLLGLFDDTGFVAIAEKKPGTRGWSIDAAPSQDTKRFDEALATVERQTSTTPLVGDAVKNAFGATWTVLRVEELGDSILDGDGKPNRARGRFVRLDVRVAAPPDVRSGRAPKLLDAEGNEYEEGDSTLLLRWDDSGPDTLSTAEYVDGAANASILYDLPQGTRAEAIVLPGPNLADPVTIRLVP